MSEECDFGLIGLAVMGENLALNVESRGYKVAVFNRTTSVVDNFIAGRAKGKKFVGCHSVEEIVKNLARPRKVMMLIKAGPAVDAVIESLIPLLDPGDIIIDGGNTVLQRHRTTHQAHRRKRPAVLRYGRFGRRRGRTQRPQHDAGWQAPIRGNNVKPIFQAIAAKVGPNNDIPCCEWVGPRGCWALRQDGTQWHRVRRHAADLRSLLFDEGSPRPVER